MASGFLMRVLVVHLLNELSSSSALPTGYLPAWQDGEKKGVTGYGTRRPLHYVRALRQSNGNLQPEDGVKRQETRSFGDRRQQQTLSSREPQKLSPSTSKFQTTRPATPRSLAINLEFPGLEFLRKNLTDRLTNKDHHGHNSLGRKPSKESGFNFQGSDILHTLQTVARPNVKLVLPFPSSPKIPIKLPSHSKETGSTVPIFDFDGVLGKTVQQMGLDLPFFTPDTQRQVEQAYETIHAHLDKLVSHHQPNPQTLTSHESPTGQRWGTRKKDVPKHKPSSQPKYPDLTVEHGASWEAENEAMHVD
ncbi:unnamed protein product [Menidia menidia]|uniref:(Atlantic silverside) hypothetical protein n=1 Tax=Menidia menidia TaxID=238744 RepID=A0A8S4BHS2_9TELE|nr:unnamed protein product [Menidia menidia]